MVFFIHTVAKTQHELAIRISFGILKKRMKTETSGGLGKLYMRGLSKKGGGGPKWPSKQINWTNECR